ncbi:hypothetical protein PSECIP111951_00049 [Pseudoalteromonas holothuriae]|uniref:Uncharacterized protein n=1 Tax=Pseudoalteromonas holothuriae TaxID=2963714 RepID=A0ABN8UFH9_9GAMM|nr:hypothetical protein [Pseudoalteromonas sp. CIP111951]CAH9049836.1 hypothetical protein PSECIP111951_00049 [Pseudoalteromonas sp. CIP111951]
MKHKQKCQLLLTAQSLLLLSIGVHSQYTRADEIVISSALSLQTGDTIVLKPKNAQPSDFVCLGNDRDSNLATLAVPDHRGVPVSSRGFYNPWCKFNVEVVDAQRGILNLSIHQDATYDYAGRYLKRYYQDKQYVSITPGWTPHGTSAFKVISQGSDLVELQADNGNYVTAFGRTISVSNTGERQFHLYTSAEDIIDGSPDEKAPEEESVNTDTPLSQSRAYMASTLDGYPAYSNKDGYGEYQLINETNQDALTILSFERQLAPNQNGATLAFEYKSCNADGKPNTQSMQVSSFGIRLGTPTPTSLEIKPNSTIGPLLNEEANGIEVFFRDTFGRMIGVWGHNPSVDIRNYIWTDYQYTNCQFKDVTLHINTDNQLSLNIGKHTILDKTQLTDEQVANIYSNPVTFFAGSNSTGLSQQSNSYAIRNIRYEGIDATFSADPIAKIPSLTRDNKQNPSEFSLLNTTTNAPSTRSVFLPPLEHAEFGFEFDYRVCPTRNTTQTDIGLAISFNQRDVISSYEKANLNRLTPELYGLLEPEKTQGVALHVGVNSNAKLLDTFDHNIMNRGAGQSLIADCTWHSAVLGTKRVTDDVSDSFAFGLYLSPNDADSKYGQANPDYALSVMHNLSADIVYEFLSQPIGLHAASKDFEGSFDIRNLNYSQNLRIDEPHENLTTTQTILNVAEVSFEEDTDADKVANWYEDSRFNINTEPTLQGTNIYSFKGNLQASAKDIFTYFKEYLTPDQKTMYLYYPEFVKMFHALQFNTQQATQQLGGHPKSRGNVWINAVGAYLQKLQAHRVDNESMENLSKQESLGKTIYLKSITPYINKPIETQKEGVTLTNTLTRDIIDGYFSGTFLAHSGFAKVSESAKYIVQFTRFDNIADRQYGAGNYPIPTVKNPDPDWQEVENWRLFHRAEVPALWAYATLGLDVYGYGSRAAGTTLRESEEAKDAASRQTREFYKLNGHNGDKLYAAAQRAVAQYQQAYLPGAFGSAGYDPMIRAAHYVRRAYAKNLLQHVDGQLASACTTSQFDYELIKNCFYPQLQADLNKVARIRQEAISDFITQKGSKGFFGGFVDWLIILLPVVEEIRAMDLVSTFSAALEEEGMSMSSFAEEGITSLEEEGASLESAILGPETVEEIDFAAFCPI